MTRSSFGSLDRRDFLRWGGGAAALGGAGLLPGRAASQARKTTLLIGTDIGDSKFMDPGRVTESSTYPILRGVYEALITMPPGEYSSFKPLLATEWGKTPDGKGLRFKLRPNVKFESGNPLTAEDVKFTFERVQNLKDQPSAQFTTNFDRVEIVDVMTVDLYLKDPTLPMYGFIASPQLAIQDSKLVRAHGGTNAPSAKDEDKATEWLDQNSAGSGPYKLVKWERNSIVQLVRNPTYWRGPAPFERIVIRHIGESAAQLLARQRGDIDIAFNLTPEQITGLRGNLDVEVIRKPSLDYMYMTLTAGADLNPALAKKEARQAVAYAIDYDGIRDSLLGGAAIRPVNFIPVGMGGSTVEQTKEFGFRQDLDKAKALLAQAGLQNGFSFDMQYGNTAYFGVSYQLIAQKVQADLARIGVKVNLFPMDTVNMRTQFVAGKSQSVISYWTGNMDVTLWTQPSIERMATRTRWEVPQSMKDLVFKATREEDQQKQFAMWLEYQKILVDNANYIILFQPDIQVAARKGIAGVNLTATGGMLEMYDIRPSG